MLITDIKRNEESKIGHVGPAMISEMARVCGLDTLVDRLGPGKAQRIKLDFLLWLFYHTIRKCFFSLLEITHLEGIYDKENTLPYCTCMYKKI